MDENNNVYSNYITTDTTSATTMMNMTMQVDDNELDGEEIKQIWNMTMQDDFYEHEHGEEIKQIWNLRFVIFAYLVAFSSAYAAVHLLDHGLWFWRSKELKNSAIIKHPDVYAACILGLGTVWCMHFVSLHCSYPIQKSIFDSFVSWTENLTCVFRKFPRWECQQ